MALLNSLNSAFSGLSNFQTELDVVGNNIANSNTPGFKFGRTDFEDSFSQTLDYASGAPVQVGTGVATSAVTNVFTQGRLSQTEVQTDLAIDGNGFFMVRNPESGSLFATRAGDFKLDSAGYLITQNGFRVQGFTDSALSSRGDILIDTNGQGARDWFSFGTNGVLTVKPAGGSEFVRGQVLLQDFTNPQALKKEGQNLWSNLDAAGPLGGAGTAASAAPGTQGLGFIQERHLESSNVDLTREFSSLINTQRAFQATARVVTTSDEVLQELVNLKR